MQAVSIEVGVNFDNIKGTVSAKSNLIFNKDTKGRIKQLEAVRQMFIARTKALMVKKKSKSNHCIKVYVFIMNHILSSSCHHWRPFQSLQLLFVPSLRPPFRPLQLPFVPLPQLPSHVQPPQVRVPSHVQAVLPLLVDVLLPFRLVKC